MLRDMKCVQRMVRVIPVRLDGSVVAGGTLTTNGILEGWQHMLVTEVGAGEYKFTFNQAFHREPVVLVTTVTDVTTCRIKEVTTAYVVIEQVGADQTTPEADGDFHMLVVGFDAADQT
jgi:hypothetical protein